MDRYFSRREILPLFFARKVSCVDTISFWIDLVPCCPWSFLSYIVNYFFKNITNLLNFLINILAAVKLIESSSSSYFVRHCCRSCFLSCFKDILFHSLLASLFLSLFFLIIQVSGLCPINRGARWPFPSSSLTG